MTVKKYLIQTFKKDVFEDTNQQEETPQREYNEEEYNALTDRQKDYFMPWFLLAYYDWIHEITPAERERINFLNAEHRKRMSNINVKSHE